MCQDVQIYLLECFKVRGEMLDEIDASRSKTKRAMKINESIRQLYDEEGKELPDPDADMDDDEEDVCQGTKHDL